MMHNSDKGLCSHRAYDQIKETDYVEKDKRLNRICDPGEFCEGDK